MKIYIRKAATLAFKVLSKLTGYTPPEKLFKHLHFKGPFKVKFPNGTSATLYSWGNRVENELAWRGWDGHERNERRRWATMISQGGDILDIGANTATFAVTAKAMFPESRVFAFEPVPRISELAKHNVAISGLDINIIQAAMGRNNGELPIYDPGGENAYSASLDNTFLSCEKTSYLVPVLSLDSFCEENSLNPTAIKLDVEGHEADVICGAKDMLSKGECVLLCEWLGTSQSHHEAAKLLIEKEYVALNVNDLSNFDLLETKGFTDRNIILVHKNRVLDIRNNWPKF